MAGPVAAMEQLTICGVGLMGGSLALAVRERRLARRVVGIDFWSGPAPGAVVDEAISPDDRQACRQAVAGSELTVLAMPVGAIQRALPDVLEAVSAAGVITDFGSTKRVVLQAARQHAARDRFVAGHPMAGHPEGGLDNARGDLFVGRRWLLCPEGACEEAVQRVTALVRALGADPVLLGAEEHDRAVALTSHVPQIVASALAALAARAGADAAAGPGFASVTRVAGGADGMWRDIFASNADAIAEALQKLGASLQEVGDALQAQPPDTGRALALLAEARTWRERRR